MKNEITELLTEMMMTAPNRDWLWEVQSSRKETEEKRNENLEHIECSAKQIIRIIMKIINQRSLISQLKTNMPLIQISVLNKDNKLLGKSSVEGFGQARQELNKIETEYQEMVKGLAKENEIAF